MRSAAGSSPTKRSWEPVSLRAAWRPDRAADSTQPPSMPFLVQSPATTRLSNPESSDRSRESTVPFGVSTYNSVPSMLAR